MKINIKKWLFLWGFLSMTPHVFVKSDSRCHTRMIWPCSKKLLVMTGELDFLALQTQVQLSWGHWGWKKVYDSLHFSVFFGLQVVPAQLWDVFGQECESLSAEMQISGWSLSLQNRGVSNSRGVDIPITLFFSLSYPSVTAVDFRDGFICNQVWNAGMS